MSETNLIAVDWCIEDPKKEMCTCSRMHRIDHVDEDFSIIFTDNTGREIGTATGFPTLGDAQKYSEGKLAWGSNKKRATITAAHIYENKTFRTFTKTVLPMKPTEMAR